MRAAQGGNASDCGKIYLRPESERCAACGRALEYVWNNDRHVRFIGGSRHIDYHVYACRNPKCPLRGVARKPEALSINVLDGYEVGLDVISLIGYYRLKMGLSYPKIRTCLDEVHKVRVSERGVENFGNLYVALRTYDVRTNPEVLKRLKKQGRLVLLIDATKPDAEGEALWMVLDHLSGEVLCGFTARAIDARGLAAKLREVAALKIPIVGVATDGEPVVVEAVKLALPGVPHQLCQFHFLQNFGKGVTKLDHELSHALAVDLKGLSRFEAAANLKPSERSTETEIAGPRSLKLAEPVARKRTGKKRQYERLCQPRTPAEAALVGEVCEAARAVLGTRAKPPLEAAGLETFAGLERLHQALARAAGKKGGSPSSCAATSTGRCCARTTTGR
jgi:hypothetical protein